MANPRVLSVDTKLYSAAEPDGRMFHAGETWPGDAWSANPGGSPAGAGTVKSAMKELIAAQEKIDALGEQLGRKDHDLAVVAKQRDEVAGQLADMEQRAIAGEQGQADADRRAAEMMAERDAARSDFQRVSDQFAEANQRLAAAEPEAERVVGLVEELSAANQTIADLNGQIEALTAPAKTEGKGGKA